MKTNPMNPPNPRFRPPFAIVATIVVLFQLPLVVFLLTPQANNMLGNMSWVLFIIEIVLTVGLLGFFWFHLNRKK